MTIGGGMPAADRERPRHLGAAPAGEELAVAVEDADPSRARILDRPVTLRGLATVPPELGDVGAPLRVENEMGRALGGGPFRQVLAVGAEDLDAIVLAVADEDAPVGGDGDAMG